MSLRLLDSNARLQTDLNPVDGEASNRLDEELKAMLLATAEKSRASFECLYVLTSTLLFESVSKLKADRAEAEAVLQEVFVNIWHECDQFDGDKDDAFEWLVALACRTASNSVHHRPRRAGGSPESRRHAALGSELPQPINIVVRSRKDESASPALRDLSAEQRAGLTLAFYDCLSPEEISRRLGATGGRH